MTQAQLAEIADLSLKYVGEIERGEANTTLDAIERVAKALEWDPLEATDPMRPSISEGVRQLLITEHERMGMRTGMLTKVLQALDPALDERARTVRFQDVLASLDKSDRAGDSIGMEPPPTVRRRVRRPRTSP